MLVSVFALTIFLAFLFYFNRYTPPCHWETGAHPSLTRVLLLQLCVRLHRRVRVYLDSLAFEGPFDIHARMMVFKVSPVIPTHALSLAMLFLIGIFGLVSQVRSSLPLTSFLCG